MFKTIELGVGLSLTLIMGMLMILQIMHIVGAGAALILSIKPIKRRARARWCKRMRIHYFR